MQKTKMAEPKELVLSPSKFCPTLAVLASSIVLLLGPALMLRGRVHLLDVGAVGVLELGLALDDAGHGREVALPTGSVIQHFSLSLAF